ncbi:MAG: phosphoribosylanthranilate isomerase [Lachnospiraceae bacterium]|nr:phosphoribosylanthranilate isomerase [Lachnospiraceae bacterium]
MEEKNKTKIKLCGMMNPPDVITAAELEADYVGFILSEGFRRTIGLGTFCELNSYLHGSKVKKVGVFVNEAIGNILEYYEEELDMIQLHGNEDENYIRELRQHTAKPIIKAFKITSAEDIQNAISSTADYVLLDSGTGTGKTFEHSLIRGIERPYFLAGGLNEDNVADIINTFHPYAIDASSCLEIDGKKDRDKMMGFVRACRLL